MDKMLKTNIRWILLGTVLIALVLLVVAACGRFGGRYHIESKAMGEFAGSPKIPLDVALVLDSGQCNYTYVSKRQHAKRVFELGETLCANMKGICTSLFRTVTVVRNKDEGMAVNVDAVIIPKVIDTSALVRPGAPPDFEATMIYECTMIDPNDHPIFVRTVKGNKFLETYSENSWGTVMQTTVDAVFSSLGNEMVASPELRKYANKMNQNP
jgi:hypothetical protein